ncbi:tetratricopeptide repeat protein [Pseudodonghicola flavimaris]|uniref:Tetratricopeptide repeat protein n=1 Tax=Pseudodonghicola flavimaris TaxID=3050036 RepID=A0ABT7F1A6_9RHOB|nr:tetratricopeptide repeat protein [Pseudodonghicola flavimaris]MDK3018372.1 tetratricopeptide repeat protein [Pseudodonghicola flavimaris]
MIASPDERPELILTLAGVFSARDRQGNELSGLSRRGQALLAFLSQQPRMRAERARLADLLWSDRPEEQARASLRQELSVLRKILPEDLLQANRQLVWLDPLRVAIDASVTGVFLDGFDLASEGFEDWLRQERAAPTVADVPEGMALPPAPDRGGRAGAPSREAPKTPAMAIFDRPSVLVVGFDCPGGDGCDSSLALGLAQEVRLNLSYWRWFPVIGPEALGYKTAGEIDVRETASALGAVYALTGAVRTSGDQVRVNVTLTATEDGKSIWSRHFDGSLENVFDFEEEVSRAIVAQIEPEISRANSQRLSQARPTDLSAWQLLLQAGDSQRRGGEGYGSREANEEQKALLRRALEKEPGLARAWAWLSKCYWHETIMGWAKDREAALSTSLNASQTALEINPTNWEARGYRATALLFGRKEFVESEFHAREAVRLNPSDATARHILGCVLENVGKVEEALEHLEAVFRLNPNHPNSAGVLGDITTCHMLLGETAEAVAAAVRLIALAPNYSRGLQRAIAALSHAGEMDRARKALDRLERIQPDFSEDYVRSTYPFEDPETLEVFVSHLRHAGAFSAGR